jgi:alkanesulfonate monooxygenase SsuD/methylene tetrahydromethanopterin reductase-like flavin-dependent oxidoreductase (luciferase family)
VSSRVAGPASFFVRGTPNEWFTYPTEVSETKGRTQEASLLIRDALTKRERFAHEGESYQFPRVSVWPGAIRQPHPPMCFSGNSPDSLEFAAEHGFGIALGFGANASILVPRYRELCGKAGWEPTPDHVLCATLPRSPTPTRRPRSAWVVCCAASIVSPNR